jgi:tripartite-type tricarboxylate transporter receptor subunit TctC
MLIALLVAVCHGGAAAASSGSGKITLAINSAAGGGYDAYGRLVARHLARFLDGSPSIIPTNMPGAGGLIAANWLFNVAPKDGSAIGIIASSALFAPFFGSDQARYRTGEFTWLASLDDYHGVGLVRSGATVKVAADIFNHELVVGGGGEGSDVTIWPKLLKSVLGARLTLINGYSGTPAIFLALERGEVDGIIGLGWESVKVQKGTALKEGTIRPLVQIAVSRHDDLPDVPTILELVRTAEDRAILELFIIRQSYSRPFLAPPGLPSQTTAELRAAFDGMTRDADFLRDAAQAKLSIAVTPGAEMKKTIDRVLASPPSVVKRAIAELGESKN